MQTGSTYVIETRELGKTYRGVEALTALNLKVPRHSIFGFLGPNGAGKTTTIKLLLGLVRPGSGSGTIFGMDMVDRSVDIRRHLGYLAQDPRYYETMTARETLRFTARFFYSGPSGEIEKRINETLELVGLEDRADRPIKGFSGGERQRLGIAQAQVNHPDLLILDEPAAALDPQGRRDVLDVMERLRGHTTIFYSTHILDDVQRVSDTVAILNKGKLVAQAGIGELLAGRGRPVYTIAARGDQAALRSALSAVPWISSLQEEPQDGRTVWKVGVGDEGAAEENLLRLAASAPGVSVLEFGRSKMNLEDAFIDIVSGGESHLGGKHGS